MIEIVGSIWLNPCQVKVVTTNGYVNRRGEAVMGRGVAEQACKRYGDEVKAKLGKLLARNGNVTQVIGLFETKLAMSTRRLRDAKPTTALLVSFPVKERWNEPARLELIERSAHQLAALTEAEGWSRVVMPRPGCGNGGLDWADVKPMLAALDDRFIVAYPKSEVDVESIAGKRTQKLIDGLDEVFDDDE